VIVTGSQFVEIFTPSLVLLFAFVLWLHQQPNLEKMQIVTILHFSAVGGHSTLPTPQHRRRRTPFFRIPTKVEMMKVQKDLF
jgi:hypothetical protein